MSEQKFKLSDRYGTFQQTEDEFSVRFERLLDHPVEKVWTAITEPDQMDSWLGPTKRVGEEGGTITVTTKGGDMGGVITRWEEYSVLEYTWWKDTVICWELFPEGADRCRLIFTHRLSANQGLSANHALGAATGWHYHMDALAITLGGDRMPHFPIQAWPDISREAAFHYEMVLRMPTPISSWSQGFGSRRGLPVN